jgi:hypothetical protein
VDLNKRLTDFTPEEIVEFLAHHSDDKKARAFLKIGRYSPEARLLNRWRREYQDQIVVRRIEIAGGGLSSAELEIVRLIGHSGVSSLSTYEAEHLEDRVLVHEAWWMAICGRLSLVDRLDLFKGLIIAEREHHWKGGSVASNIWVFRAIERDLSLDERNTLLDWALRNRGVNPYTPLGFRTSARNIEDYRAERTSEKNRWDSHLAKMSSESTAKQKRLEHKADAAQLHIERRRQRTEQRSALIERLTALPITPRIGCFLAQTDFPIWTLPPTAFPLNVVPQIADDDLRRQFSEQLQGLKGYWRHLREALEGRC